MAQLKDIDDYKSVITPELQIVGTDDRESFIKNYLENKELRS
jgi:hypothetical protein